MSPEIIHRFEHLSSPIESLRPLIPSDIDIPSMRASLAEAGVNLNITETARESLNESKFHNLESGRGIGIVAALGETKATALLDWCHQRSGGGPKIGGHEGTEGRGLRQLAADIIQLVTTLEPSQELIRRFCLRTNQRVMKGLLWENRGNKQAKATIRQAFADIPKPKSKFSSVPSGSVVDLWEFLTSK